MKITVERIKSNSDATLSVISIDDDFICFGLEDGFRPYKVMSETRIPAGTYKIEVREYGGFHKRYSKSFSNMHKGMLEIKSVIGFTDILIHVGNTHIDTAGCLLVGLGANTSNGLSIQSSVLAYKKLYKKVIDHAEKSQVIIEFIDND